MRLAMVGGAMTFRVGVGTALAVVAMSACAADRLHDAVEQVRRESGGEILSAQSVQTREATVYRIKVLTRDGRVEVHQVVANDAPSFDRLPAAGARRFVDEPRAEPLREREREAPFAAPAGLAPPAPASGEAFSNAPDPLPERDRRPEFDAPRDPMLPRQSPPPREVEFQREPTAPIEQRPPAIAPEVEAPPRINPPPLPDGGAL